MDGSLLVLCAIAFVIAFLWAVRTPSNWQKLVIQSAKDENIEPLINAWSKRPPLVGVINHFFPVTFWMGSLVLVTSVGLCVLGDWKRNWNE